MLPLRVSVIRFFFFQKNLLKSDTFSPNLSGHNARWKYQTEIVMYEKGDWVCFKLMVDHFHKTTAFPPQQTFCFIHNGSIAPTVDVCPDHSSLLTGHGSLAHLSGAEPSLRGAQVAYRLNSRSLVEASIPFTWSCMFAGGTPPRDRCASDSRWLNGVFSELGSGGNRVSLQRITPSQWSASLAGKRKRPATPCVREVAHVCLHPPQANCGVSRDMNHRAEESSHFKLGEHGQKPNAQKKKKSL